MPPHHHLIDKEMLEKEKKEGKDHKIANRLNRSLPMRSVYFLTDCDHLLLKED